MLMILRDVPNYIELPGFSPKYQVEKLWTARQPLIRLNLLLRGFQVL